MLFEWAFFHYVVVYSLLGSCSFLLVLNTLQRKTAEFFLSFRQMNHEFQANCNLFQTQTEVLYCFFYLSKNSKKYRRVLVLYVPLGIGIGIFFIVP